MKLDTEINELRKHFDRRGLDQSEVMQIITSLAGISIGLAASDDGDVERRMHYVVGWIRDAARRIVGSINQSERLQ